jgi:hypothetical protein
MSLKKASSALREAGSNLLHKLRLATPRVLTAYFFDDDKNKEQIIKIIETLQTNSKDKDIYFYKHDNDYLNDYLTQTQIFYTEGIKEVRSIYNSDIRMNALIPNTIKDIFNADKALTHIYNGRNKDGKINHVLEPFATENSKTYKIAILDKFNCSLINYLIYLSIAYKFSTSDFNDESPNNKFLNDLIFRYSDKPDVSMYNLINILHEYLQQNKSESELPSGGFRKKHTKTLKSKNNKHTRNTMKRTK